VLHVDIACVVERYTGELEVLSRTFGILFATVECAVRKGASDRVILSDCRSPASDAVLIGTLFDRYAATSYLISSRKTPPVLSPDRCT
jgi:hypothetical protein